MAWYSDSLGVWGTWYRGWGHCHVAGLTSSSGLERGLAAISSSLVIWLSARLLYTYCLSTRAPSWMGGGKPAMLEESSDSLKPTNLVLVTG